MGQPSLDPEPFQPGPLVRDHMRQSPTEVADGASKVTIMPTTQRLKTSMAMVRSGQPMGSRKLIDHDQVDGGVIDLDEIERPLRLRATPPPTPRCRRLVPLPSADDHHRIQSLDPGWIVFLAGGRIPAWRRRRATSRVRAASDRLGRAR